MSQWQDAFPEFPADTMPEIPAHWTDSSWRNDACPCFEVGDEDGKHLRVWVDFADPATREFPELLRFTIMVSGGEDRREDAELLSTDDWSEVLAAVTKWEAEQCR